VDYLGIRPFEDGGDPQGLDPPGQPEIIYFPNHACREAPHWSAPGGGSAVRKAHLSESAPDGARGPDKGHIIQNAFYALALKSDYHAITYIASDDYRIYTTILDTVDFKKEINQIIKDFDEAVESKTIPVFEPREKWQSDSKYNMFQIFAGLNAEQLQAKYKELKI